MFSFGETIQFQSLMENNENDELTKQDVAAFSARY